MRYYDPQIGRYVTQDPIGQFFDVNIYRYVYNNPILLIDPLGLGQFCKRKLQGHEWNFLSDNPISDALDLEKNHEQYFFDDGDSVGYFKDGVGQDGLPKSEYQQCDGEEFDDDIIRKVLPDVPGSSPEDYGVISNNCQDWADRLRDKYREQKWRDAWGNYPSLNGL